ncbi:response regulator [Pseudodesulfovibrio cashew]|nr:response regulator [Pseudodesulfovibrio cashew]
MHGSIRKKLIFLVLLATLPVFAVLLVNQVNERNDDVRLAEQDIIIFLHGFSEVQRGITDSTRTLLGTISELPEIRNGDPVGSRRILSTLLKANPIYTNAILVDLAGKVVAMGRGQDKGLNFSDRKQFRDAVRTKRFASGEFVIGKQTGNSIFPFGMPVLNEDGGVEGVVLIGVDLEVFGGLYDKSRYPGGAFFGLCDHRGLRLYRHPMPEGLNLGDPIVRRVFEAAKGEDRPGLLNAVTSEGVPRIVAFEPLRLTPDDPPYMYMFMGLDHASIVARANRSLLYGAVVAVISLCCALLFAWLLGWKAIAAKIDRLALAARRLGRGEEGVSSGVPYEDGEIGQLAQSFDTMSVLLKKREVDLHAAKEAAEAANKAKDEFLANISHEVRTPLNGVMGMLQLAKEAAVCEEQRSYLNTALDSSRSLLRVLNDLLDFIKVGAGKLELLEEPFDLKELLEQVAGLFRQQVAEKGVSLETEIHSCASGYYLGDAGRLRQVMFNLMGNAIKFTHTGSITIEVSAEAEGKEGIVRLDFAIKDTGVGIPEDKLEYIFDAFTQVDGSLSREYQGTGLGLPIVKNLVSLMGGKCVLKSTVGKGTMVFFSVKMLRGRKPGGEAPVRVRPVESPPLRILLVEDERVNRIMARSLLDKMGHTVVTAENGAAALGVLLEQSVDVVLMDIQMPVMDGLEATRIIRTSPEHRGHATVPVIALSAHAADHDKQRARKAGVNEYLTKPFEKEALMRVLLTVIPGGE